MQTMRKRKKNVQLHLWLTETNYKSSELVEPDQIPQESSGTIRNHYTVLVKLAER